MDIKPLFQTETVKVVAPKENIRELDTKIVRDPSGVVPASIYRVIKWESIRQHLTAMFSFFILLGMGTWIALLVINERSWGNYILPVCLSLIFTYKFFITLVEISALKRAVLRYREDLKYNLSSTPPFLVKMYLSLHRKQVGHNWITFTIIFYGGIFTLLLWTLKDVNWWIFNFELWINTLFGNPILMSWIFTISLLVVAVFHIILTVQRKKKILEMDSFYGSALAPNSEIDLLKRNYNKMYRRLFLISLLVIVVIPLFVLIFYKLLRRRR